LTLFQAHTFKWKRFITYLLGLVIFASGMLTLISYIIQSKTGNPWVVHFPLLEILTNEQYRMIQFSAVNFMIFSAVLFLLGHQNRFVAGAGHVILLPMAASTYLVLIGYLFQIPMFHDWLHQDIPFNTGIGFAAICLASLYMRTDTWLMKVFIGQEAGAVIARRLLPALFILPLVIGWLRIESERIGLFSSEFGSALVATTYTVCFLGLIWINARSLNRADRLRRQAEDSLRESEGCVRRKLESILSPEGDVEVLELSDIIDPAGIQKLMDNFYPLAHIPMAIIDLKGKVLVGVGWQDICTKFHRVNPETCKNCIESDLQLSDGIPEGEFKLYKCKNGMWDMATPIIVGGRKMGNLFMGQFFFENEKPDRDFFRQQGKKFKFNEKAYLEALDRVPQISKENIEYGKVFFMRLAAMLSAASYSNIKLARSLSKGEALNKSLLLSEQRLSRAQEIAHLGSWTWRKISYHGPMRCTGSSACGLKNSVQPMKHFTAVQIRQIWYRYSSFQINFARFLMISKTRFPFTIHIMLSKLISFCSEYGVFQQSDYHA